MLDPLVVSIYTRKNSQRYGQLAPGVAIIVCVDDKLEIESRRLTLTGMRLEKGPITLGERGCCRWCLSEVGDSSEDDRGKWMSISESMLAQLQPSLPW